MAIYNQLRRMSKKFYVLFSLKEVFQPKIFKTKPTVQKHLNNNPSLDFRHFNSEQEALKFSKRMEGEVNKKVLGSTGNPTETGTKNSESANNKIEKREQSRISEEFARMKLQLNQANRQQLMRDRTVKNTKEERDMEQDLSSSMQEKIMNLSQGPLRRFSPEMNSMDKGQRQLGLQQSGFMEVEEEDSDRIDEMDSRQFLTKEALLQEIMVNIKRIQTQMTFKQQPHRKDKSKVKAEVKSAIEVSMDVKNIQRIKESQLPQIQVRDEKIVMEEQSNKNEVNQSMDLQVESKIQDSLIIEPQTESIVAQIPLQVRAEEVKTGVDQLPLDIITEKVETVVELNQSEVIKHNVENIADQIPLEVMAEEVEADVDQLPYIVKEKDQTVVDQLHSKIMKENVDNTVNQSPQEVIAEEAESVVDESPQEVITEQLMVQDELKKEQIMVGQQVKQDKVVELVQNINSQLQVKVLEQQITNQVQQSLQLLTQHQEPQQQLQTNSLDIKSPTFLQQYQPIQIDPSYFVHSLHNPIVHSQHINLSQLHLQAKLYQLQQQQVKQNIKEGKLTITFSQKQNPGLSIVEYQLETKLNTIRKIELLGVKNKAQAEAISLKKGLQFASFNQIKNLYIQSSFRCLGPQQYKYSIDKNLRQIVDAIPIQQSFDSISYL